MNHALRGSTAAFATGVPSGGGEGGDRETQRDLLRFSKQYRPLLPGQTRSMSPSPSRSTAVISRPVPAVPGGKSFWASRLAASVGASLAGSPVKRECLSQDFFDLSKVK